MSATPIDPNEIKSALAGYTERLGQLKDVLGAEAKNVRIGEIEKLMEAPDFWDNPEAAQGVIDEMKKLKNVCAPLADAEKTVADLNDLLELAEMEDDADTFGEVAGELDSLNTVVDEIELRSLLSGPNDDKDVFFSVHAGAGGNDACECAEMILRMYLRFFERRKWKVEELAFTAGEEAGIRGVTYRVAGENVYGYMRGEIGVHRVVRMSPFSGKRETSFVGVDAIPEFEDTAIDIKDEDLRIDTYRSGGKGGQHVNKTDSAVRITHLPTGVVVAVQNERSQHKNKAMALKLLKARLQRLEDSKRQKELGDLYSEKGEIAFGSQIRNYVFQPYTQVKDSRTGFESGDVTKVMDGDLDGFINAYLHWYVEKNKK